jgi:hypothetical protein
MVQNISLILSGAAVKSRSALSSALGPVMGDAIQVQIRDSQDEMVEALYPIILATVQRAIAEFGRDLQRNIDARLKATLGPRGALQTFFARLRGVSASELVLRESLPFYIDELFLIQRDTGLLMAHSYDEEREAHDSDLIGGMLTAIRDFTRDSFGDGTLGEELDEIQYGEERIIIESGASAYVAAVVRGVEPQGFRGRLRAFMTELHGQYGQQFADFDGDMATLPDLAPALAGFDHEFSSIATAKPQAMPRSQRLMLWGAGLAGLLLLACSCFYLQFTVALLPAAFGNTPTIAATALPTETIVPSATPTATATATASASATVPPSPTSTPAPTETAMPSPTATASATAIAPSITPTVVLPVTNAPVWTRSLAADDAPLETIIAAQTVVTILDRDGEWVEVSWDSDQGPRRGWIVSRFLDLNGEALENLIVPAPGG